MNHPHNPPLANGIDSRGQRLMRLASYASVGTAVLLIGLKTWAWSLTGSVALLSSLVDSLMDAFASVITMVTVAHALVPADKEHRFGHGKAESLGALAQAAFVTASAVLLMVEAASRFYRPQPVTATEIGTAVMLASILLSLLLLAFQHLVVKRTNSLAIKADAAHYMGDLLPNIGVILTLWLAGPLGWTYMDPAFAFAIACYLLYTAWKIGREALDVLMDRELPDEDRKTIHDLAMAHSEVIMVRDLRTRQAGAVIFIQMDLELPPGISLDAAHTIADKVTGDIRNLYPTAEIMVHEFPEGAHG